MVENKPETIIETFESKVKKLDDTITEDVTALKANKNQTITKITNINEKINSEHVQFKQVLIKNGENFKIDLGKRYNLYLKKTASVKEKLTTVSTRLFNSQYFAICVLLLSIIFFLTHLPSISDVFQNSVINGIIPVLLVFTIISFVIFTRETFKKINEVNPEPIEDLTTDLNGVEFEDVSVYDFKEDIIEQKRSTDQLISSAQSALDIILYKIPMYKDYVEDEHFRRKWELGCDEYQNALKFFGLNYKVQFQKLKDKPNIDSKRVDDSILDSHILSDVSMTLNISSAIVQILVQYYRGNNAQILWEEIKKDTYKFQLLSHTLYNSNQIDIDRLRLSETDFQNIILKTKEFSISQISKNSSLFVQIKLKLENYEKILIENEIPLEKTTDFDELINSINFNQTFEKNFLNVLSHKIIPILPVEQTQAYEKAIIAILLNDEILFKDIVCKDAKDDDTVLVLMTYHEMLRERKENKQVFKLNDLLVNLHILESTKERIQTEVELKNRFVYFKNDLSRGFWWDDGLSLQRKMFDDLKQDFSQKIDKLDRSIIITKLFEKTFTEININTVDKAIDANLFSTYLILTSASKGHLLPFLDPISIRNPDKTKKDFSELKTYEKKYGITLIKDGKPKYDFTNYSTRTRIGVLPRNTNFLAFVQEMKDDVNKILQAESQFAEEEMEDIGLAIIRVTPSKYSFGLLDDEIEKSSNVRTKDLHIAKIIAILAKDYTSNSEQYLMSAFDGKINLTEIFNQLSIFELIPAKEMDLSPEYEGFLKSDSLKKAILASLKKEGISSIKVLSKTVRSNKENHIFLKSIISEAIVDEYFKRKGVTIQTSRLNFLMSELMKSLDSIAELMENLS